MNKSPAASVRVSIDTPPNSTDKLPDTIVPRNLSRAAATHPAVRRIADLAGTAATSDHAGIRATPRQRLSRDGDVVERQHAFANHLVLFMALARDQHDIAGASRFDRRDDGQTP